MVNNISSAIIPAIIFLCGILLLTSKKPLYEAFMTGAKRGFTTSIELLPTFCLLFCAIAMFSECGISDYLSDLLSNVGIPDGLAPFLLIRPISGGASTAILTDIFENFGADSKAGIAASIIMSSSDTLIYIISIYQSAAGIKRSRWTVIPAFLAMSAVCVTAILLA